MKILMLVYRSLIAIAAVAIVWRGGRKTGLREYPPDCADASRGDRKKENRFDKRMLNLIDLFYSLGIVAGLQNAASNLIAKDDLFNNKNGLGLQALVLTVCTLLLSLSDLLLYHVVLYERKNWGLSRLLLDLFFPLILFCLFNFAGNSNFFPYVTLLCIYFAASVIFFFHAYKDFVEKIGLERWLFGVGICLAGSLFLGLRYVVPVLHCRWREKKNDWSAPHLPEQLWVIMSIILIWALLWLERAGKSFASLESEI